MFLWTIAVWLLVSAGTFFLTLKLAGGNARAVERLGGRVAARPQFVNGFVPSPALIWHELVSWAGSVVPAAPKSLSMVKRRLLRAGFRDPMAVRLFYGARTCLTALFGVAGLIFSLRQYAASDKLLMVTGAAAMVGYIAPMQYLTFRIRRRKHAIEKALPNVLDLMVVCVESGLGLDQTIIQVAKELHGPHPELCEEFAVINLELRAGKRRPEALHNLAERTGVEDIKKLVAVLIQTDRFGTSIAQSLRGHADYLRVMARQRAEEKAAKLAVKLVFPIFFCVLPSLFVVTVGPVITRLVRDLLPAIENM